MSSYTSACISRADDLKSSTDVIPNLFLKFASHEVLPLPGPRRPSTFSWMLTCSSLYFWLFLMIWLKYCSLMVIISSGWQSIFGGLPDSLYGPSKVSLKLSGIGAFQTPGFSFLWLLRGCMLLLHTLRSRRRNTAGCVLSISNQGLDNRIATSLR